MARYRALRKSFINGYLREEGEEFDFSGQPGSSLYPMDDEAKEAKAKAGRKSTSVAASSAPDEPEEADIQTLRDQYRELYGEAPHPAKKSDRLRQDIADKRKEIGV